MNYDNLGTLESVNRNFPHPKVMRIVLDRHHKKGGVLLTETGVLLKMKIRQQKKWNESNLFDLRTKYRVLL